MVPLAEVSHPGLQDVELHAGFQQRDDLGRFGALGLVHRRRHDLHAHIVTPGLVLGRLFVFFAERLGEDHRGFGRHLVIPQALPVTGDRVDPGTPETGGIHNAAGYREGQPEFLVLPQERRLVAAGEVDVNEIRLGPLDFQDIRAVVRCSSRNQIVRDHGSALLGQKTGGDPRQVMTEGIVSREHVEVLALHISLAVLPVADGLGVHGVPGLDMEREAVALLAPECVGVTTGLHVHGLQPIGRRHHTGAGTGTDFTDEKMHFPSFDQLLGLRRRDVRSDTVLGEQVHFPAQDSAGRVQFLHGQVHTPERVIAKRAEKTTSRRDVTDPDCFRGLEDRRKADLGERVTAGTRRGGAQHPAPSDTSFRGLRPLSVRHLRPPSG